MLQGITFDYQRVSAASHGAIFKSCFTDGILTGCELTINSVGQLCLGAGYILCAGRAIYVPNTQIIEFSTNHAIGRAFIQINLNGSSSYDDFSQATIETDGANSVEDLPPLSKEDVNNGGIVYQMQLCVCDLRSGAVESILSKVGKSKAPSSDYAFEAAHSGEADYAYEAENASEASHAINADLAKRATSATSATVCTGNAETATALKNPRTICGVSFDGTNNITAAQMGVAVLDGNGVVTGSQSYAPVKSLTGNYTLKESDLNTMLISDASAPITITVPEAIGANGCEFEAVQFGSGAVTVRAGSSSVKFYTNGSVADSFTIRTQYCGVSFKRKSANGWLVFGDVVI